MEVFAFIEYLPDSLAVQPCLEDGDVLKLVRRCQKGVFAQDDKV